LVVVIDTEIDDALRAEGDARELARAVQDLRKASGLELDEPIELWLVGAAEVLAPLQPHLGRVADDTLASRLRHDAPPADARTVSQGVTGGEIQIALVAGAEPRA
jgi:isoleucyl-tRNA synthetase